MLKKTLLTLALLSASLTFAVSPCRAEGGSPALTWAGIELILPLAEPSVVYLYDFIGKENLLGLETALLRIEKWKNATVVVGAVADIDGGGDSALTGEGREFLNGKPFVGLHMDVPEFLLDDKIKIGGFYGRDFSQGKNIIGLKSSFEFRFW